MAGKVLKIDVLVDESGTARRALTEIEGGVKKVEASATASGPAVKSFTDKLDDWDKKMLALEQSIGSAEAAVAMSAESVVTWSTGIGFAMTAASAAGIAIAALGSYLKESTEYYVEQSGVLEINREAVDGLVGSWDALKFTIGEVIVGGDGDFRSWIKLVNVALLEMGVTLGTDIELLKTLGTTAKGVITGSAFNADDPGSVPGIDTSVRNPDGSLTPYGRMLEQRKKNTPEGPFGTLGGNEPFSGSQAEAMTMAEISREKREQLELEREQKREAEELLKYTNEHVKLENDLTQALERSRAQYDGEIAAAERLNQKRKEGLDLSIRDNFLKGQMSKEGGQQYDVVEGANRKIAAIDPRAGNAAELTRRYQAERDLALLQLRQASEGMTQGLADDLNHFRAEYADVVGQLPASFQEIVPPILDASGQLRDGLSADLQAIRGQTDNVSSGFVSMGATVRATKAQIAAGLKAADDAYNAAGILVHPTMETSRLRSQQTGGLLFAAGGLVEPRYLAGGGGAGTDTVPAMLTPGEGVLSRVGMSALDRLNSGMASMGRSGGIRLEKGAVVIDARGAQFTDDRALEVLADKVQQQLAKLDQRYGG
jgi:uncharacterized protein YukE